MQIKRIVIYNADGRTRELPFRLGRVNIITGPSERGKSAVLAIIDYCLGASRLGVPAGLIQNAVSWYAVELDIDGERMFIARPGASSPGSSTTQWHLAFGEGEIPVLQELRPTYSKEEVLRRISGKLGIGVTLLARQDGRFDRRQLTFRSALTYCLQKQNEIANPDLFFHRQGETGVAQSIRDTLPYYLGAISEEVIASQEDLRRQRNRLREVERRLSRSAELEPRRNEELSYLLSEARRVGLLDRQSAAQASDEAALAALRDVQDLVADPVGGPDNEVLPELTKQIADLRWSRVSLLREIESLQSFGEDQSAVENGVNEQRKRLKSLGLFSLSEDGSAEICPICHSQMKTPVPTAEQMSASLHQLSHQLSFVSQDQSALKEVIANRRGALAELDSRIGELRSRVARLRQEDSRVRDALERRNEAARIGGMIHMFFRTSGEVTKESRAELEAEAESLGRRIEELEEETDFKSVAVRSATFLGSIGQLITSWARELALGYSTGLLTFDIRGPRLVSETESGTIPFSRFGSGKNWVWYHLIGHMALHKWFVENSRPTPRFLVIDQPSQVYFPAGHQEEGQTDLDEVRRIYHWLFDNVAKLDGAFQVIVMDHARFPEDKRFVDHIAHDWWEGGALVPKDWLS